MKETKQYNGIISLWRFIFCIVVVLFHIARGGFFPNTPSMLFNKSGDIAVEFFFVVAGYFLCHSALKPQTQPLGKSTNKYLLDRYKQFLPHVIISAILCLILSPRPIRELPGYAWQVGLVNMGGIEATNIMYHIWYLSALIVASAILFPLVAKYKENFIRLFCPLITVVIAGFLQHQYGNLDSIYIWNGIVTTGTLRALMSMSLGGVVYLVARWLRSIDFNLFGRICLTTIEVGGRPGCHPADHAPLGLVRL